MKKWKFSSFYIFQLKVIAIFVSQRVCTYTRCIVSLMDGYRSITLINNLLKVEGHQLFHIPYKFELPVLILRQKYSS